MVDLWASTRAMILAVVPGLVLLPTQILAAESKAFFLFEQSAPTGEVKQFTFKLVDAAKIAQARAILAKKAVQSVKGTIVKTGAPYNPEWSFHLDPPTIVFPEENIEVCDANVVYVEAHLDEVGGSTLPHSVWCPWSSRLAAEVTDLIDPTTEKPKP
jgi:hypothetical protein